jgi:hypothetical protein
MKRFLRFVFFWRFLLLACLVLAAAGDYLFVRPLRSTVAPAPQPSLLRVKFKEIEEGMTESEIVGILGPPHKSTEIDAIKGLCWREGQDTVVIFFHWSDVPRVLKKHFRTEPELPR